MPKLTAPEGFKDSTVEVGDHTPLDVIDGRVDAPDWAVAALVARGFVADAAAPAKPAKRVRKPAARKTKPR